MLAATRQGSYFQDWLLKSTANPRQVRPEPAANSRYTSAAAESGDQALWAVTAHEPAGLILDVMIPHPSGLEVCRHLRSDGYGGAIVVISARGNPDDRAAALRAGADAFLAKPFTLSDLTDSLDAALATRAAQ